MTEIALQERKFEEALGEDSIQPEGGEIDAQFTTAYIIASFYVSMRDYNNYYECRRLGSPLLKWPNPITDLYQFLARSDT